MSTLQRRFVEQYLRDRLVIQVQLDAVLVAVEATRTLIDAMAPIDKTISDELDLIVAAVDVVQIDYDKTIADVVALQAVVDLMTRMTLNHGLTQGDIAIGTNKAKVDLGTTIEYINQGLFKSKAAAIDVWTLAGTTVNASNDTAERCKWLLTLQADGTAVATQGAIVIAASTAVLPACPANETPVGYFEIETDSSNDFIPGTTEFDAAGMTDTFVDLVWPNNGVDALAAVSAITGAAVGDQGITIVGAVEETALGATGLSAIGTMQPL